MATVWRIGQDTPEYEAHDLSGRGGEIAGGRWSRKGRPIVYSAGSISLAALETMAHLDSKGLPLNRYLVEITIPDAVWKKKIVFSHDQIPVGWDALPTGKVSLDFGDAWLAGGRSALALVPSVIVTEEFNVLINPRHPGAAQIAAKKLRKWLYDSRIAP
jgi:RES domain-containing protein